MPAPGWVSDPSGRYHQRYFDGAAWTEHVADEYGRRGIDPVDSIPRAAAQPPTTGQLPAVYTGPPAGYAPASRSAPDGDNGVALTLAVLGAIVGIAAIAFLPWFEDFRVTQGGSAPVGAGTSEIVKSSYLESGWIVTIVALLGAVAATLALRRVVQWLAAGLLLVCLAWALVSTLWLNAGDSAPSLAPGFFVAILGVVLAVAGIGVAAAGLSSGDAGRR